MRFYGKREVDESLNTRNPLFKRRSTWIATSSGLIVIIGVVGYFTYQNVQYNDYLETAITALSLNEYKTALSDFQDASRYSSNPVLQSDLQKAQSLVQSHDDYLAGMNALQQGHLQQAYIDLSGVISTDTLDYAKALSQRRNVHDIILVNKVVKDYNSFIVAESNADAISNTIAGTENSLTNDTSQSSFQADISSLSNESNGYGNEISNVQSAIQSIDTDAQLISNPKITAIITPMENALTKLEDDESTMSADASDELLSAQQYNRNWGAYYGGFYLTTPTTGSWNKAIGDVGKQENLITTYESRLKAYASQLQSTGTSA